MCVGDCDKDSDCAGNLRCSERYGGEDVPGCDWKEGDEALKADSSDFCKFRFKHLQSLHAIEPSIKIACIVLQRLTPSAFSLYFNLIGFLGFAPISQPGVVNYVGECSEGGYLCGECEGDCDGDTSCKEGLACFEREGFERVPGCTGEGSTRDVFAKDMCYKPEPMEYIDS